WKMAFGPSRVQCRVARNRSHAFAPTSAEVFSGQVKSHERAGRSSRANGAPHAREKRSSLQQARRPEASHRINQRHRLPLEDPASHRKSQRRVTQMNKFHSFTPKKMRHST